MDVLSINHFFGQELEKSFIQLFVFFCNNIELGQWQVSKACLKELTYNKKKLKFYFDNVLLDIIQEPDVYNFGSFELESHYHFSLNLFEFCSENKYFVKDENLYNQILLKFLVYGSVYSLFSKHDLKSDAPKIYQINKIMNELNNLFSNELRIIDYLEENIPDLNTLLTEYLTKLLVMSPYRSKSVLQLLFKYNPLSKFLIIKYHLNAISTLLKLDEKKADTQLIKNSDLSFTENFNTKKSIRKLINQLDIYDLSKKCEIESFEHFRHKSLKLIKEFFKDVCFRLNSLCFRNNAEDMEENYQNIYIALMFEYKNQTKVDEITLESNLLKLFSKIHNEVNDKINLSKGFSYENLNVLSVAKQYFDSQYKESYFWKRIFLHSITENRIILESAIDEAMFLISKNQFENLNLLFNIKEFLILKPLILLVGITKIQDIQSARKFITSLCLNCEKDQLINKIGNFLKTHLDFITWYQMRTSENKKKEITFNELIKLLQRQLPLNIISQYIEVSKIEYSEINKILKNTLTDKDDCYKTKWVRFLDDINERVTQIQENCLIAYDGFFCINEVLKLILYCCQNLNRKFQPKRSKINNSKNDIVKKGDIQHEYNTFVVYKLNDVKEVLKNIFPLNYRLEVLENIYSLIFISTNDLKIYEADNSDQESEPSNEKNIESHQFLDNLSNNDVREITEDCYFLNKKVKDDYFIYDTNNKSLHDASNRSSKTNLDSLCSNYSLIINKDIQKSDSGSNEEDNLNKKSKSYNNSRNIKGGLYFLVNDFLCRDLLIILKDTLQKFPQFESKTNSVSHQSLHINSNYNSSSEKPNTILTQSIKNSDIIYRVTKLEELVNETLWRFQLVKPDKVDIEYGIITSLLDDEPINRKAINQQNTIYEMLKKKKKRSSSNSNFAIFNESIKNEESSLKFFDKSSKKIENSLKLNKTRSTTLNSNGYNSILRKDKRRSLESQRSLSLIPPNNEKISNSTIMKILSDIGTLSSLYLKRSKISETSQFEKIFKLKDSSESFEFTQIQFNLAFEQAFKSLDKLEQNETRLNLTLAQKSLLMLEISKITETVIMTNKENEDLKSIYITDFLTTLKSKSLITSYLLEFLHTKISQNLNKLDNQRDILSSSENQSDNSKVSKINDRNKERNLDFDIATKLFFFIEKINQLFYQLDEEDKVNFPDAIKNLVINFDSIFVGLVDNSQYKSKVNGSVQKYQFYKKFNFDLNIMKTEFEKLYLKLSYSQSSGQEIQDLFLKLVNFINDSIRLKEGGDLISTYFYKPKIIQSNVSNNCSINSLMKETSEPLSSSIEKRKRNEFSSLNSSLMIVSRSNMKNSNFLLSFYEYLKILFEYFQEKSLNSNSTSILDKWSSFFSILNYSPASLISRLLFVDLIKPQLVEPLLNKLNLNLTAIILHSSCPRLKLNRHENSSNVLLDYKIESLAEKFIEIRDNDFKNKNETYVLNEIKSKYSDDKEGSSKNEKKNAITEHQTSLLESNLYNLNYFTYFTYTILNETDVCCCSRKKPDEFVRSLLLRLLKYCQDFMKKYYSMDEKITTNKMNESNILFSEENLSGNENILSINIAEEIYQCAEFKTILNESQELQHLNLHFLETDYQKLSFFINLYNLLSIHSNFYLASISSSLKSGNFEKRFGATSTTLNEPNVGNLTNSSSFYRNKTEKLLFQQTMCYKVGQMGCVSLYDLKYHILMRKFFNETEISIPNCISFESFLKSRENEINSKLIGNFKENEHKSSNENELLKYSLYKIDLEAEPFWSHFLPNEKVCDLKVMFALSDCTEADPPIRIYDSNNLLDDQLQMQMRLFLNETIYADLRNECLFIPKFLIENYFLFLENSPDSTLNDIEAVNNKNIMESLVRFLTLNVNEELKCKIKSLLDLDSIHGFGENIDRFGRKELPFSIIKINDSNKFSLVFENNHEGSISNNNWFIKELKSMLSLIEKQKVAFKDLKVEKNDQDLKQTISDYTSNNLNDKEKHELLENSAKLDKVLYTHELNKECLEYIGNNSPLISKSLSFLFDSKNRSEFFEQIAKNYSSNLNDNFEHGLSTKSYLHNPLNRFIQLYVPLDYMDHLTTEAKLNLISQFLLTNYKTEESKIEMVIDLTNYYGQNQDWNLVIKLLDNCTQNNEDDLNDANLINLRNFITPEEFDETFIYQNAEKNGYENLNLCRKKQFSRYSQKDFYNLYDHACVCLSLQESKNDHLSYKYLFKMKNFLRQVRAIFGLMHLWSIDGCLEMIDFCLNKTKIFEQPKFFYNSQAFNIGNIYSKQKTSYKCLFSNNLIEYHNQLINILKNKKLEFSAYKELTNCARITLEKYYEHQQLQDAAGFCELYNKSGFSSINTIDSSFNNSNFNKMKKICQKCLTWQYAKAQLESSSVKIEDETNELIMDLFLLNDQFTSAKYLIKKLNLGYNLKFKLDFGHLKYRLLNLNFTSSIIVIDLDLILKECISFENDNINDQKKYLFDICFKLLNELKNLKELNNQVLVCLIEYLIKNFHVFLNEKQLFELRILQLTAKIFQILIQDSTISFDSYKRHHSEPILIVEQLIMNSQIDLCSKIIKICRDTLNESSLNASINELLVKYAYKAIEFHVNKMKEKLVETDELYINNKNNSPLSISNLFFFTTNQIVKSKSTNLSNEITNSSQYSNEIVSPLNLSSNAIGNEMNMPKKEFNLIFQQNSNAENVNLIKAFAMPAFPPSKENWIKDDEVNICMVCNLSKFSIINRRHHCRRCGRVVCSNCSQKTTLIENIMKRTCDDCFNLIESQKGNYKHQIDDFKEKSNKDDKNKKEKNQTSNKKENSYERNDQKIEFKYYLHGGTYETSAKLDTEIRNSFRYQQAPSTSLCLSILDLHDNPLEVGKNLLKMCDDLSGKLQIANYQVQDFGLIISIIKHLLHNAKVKLLQNSSSNLISLCDTYLSLIDVLEQLLLANSSIIPSLNELRNTELVRRIRNRLLEEERYDLAMNLSTKCGLDTQTVWGSWGLVELKRGNYKEARNKFEKCLKPLLDKNSNVFSQAQNKILNDIITFLESAPPIRMFGPQCLIGPRSVETLIAEPNLYPIDNSNFDEVQFKEAIYYLELYGTHNLIVSFYQRNAYLEKAILYLIENKCNNDIFLESLFVPCLRNGEFYKLMDYFRKIEKHQNKLYSYFSAIGKYLEKNFFLKTLYDFQIITKDYVRACMSCICFFNRNCENYSDLFNNVHYLIEARQHLEEYLETNSKKQHLTSTQQQFSWKSKFDHQNLCKLITTQEVDNYLNAINLQIEVTKFIKNCFDEKKNFIENKKCPTLFGNNENKINLCCLILLSGKSVQEGFGFVIRIIQCFNLNSTLVYSEIARELAKQYNFKEINNLLKCINDSGYKNEIDLCYDECISTCIRVFNAYNSSFENSIDSKNINKDQLSNIEKAQFNKEIEELIQLIKDDENKINAYILNGRLKSAYLIAIKNNRADIVKHISNVAERMGQNLIKDICIKWLEKINSSKN